jgi:DNA-binding MurR/RpiR family transcriptional regulator
MNTTNNDDGTSLQARISARLATMTRAERRVAEYLRNHSEDVVFATAEQIGAASQTSDATVVRTAKRLGYSGLIELKYSLGRQAISATKPVVRMHNRIEQAGGETASLLEQVFVEATERLAETLRIMPVTQYQEAVALLAGAGTVVGFGIGPSELNAQYLALRLRRIGRSARATGATGFRLADDLLALTAGDVVVLYTPGRLLADTSVLLDHVVRVGARAILITDSLGPILRDRVDVILPSVYSPSGFSGEGLSAQVLTDALVLGVAAQDFGGAAATAELLAGLRSELTDGDSTDYVRRRDRRPAEPDTKPKSTKRRS